MRLYELARKLGIKPGDLLEHARSLGVKVTTVHASVSDRDAGIIEKNPPKNGDEVAEAQWLDLAEVMTTLQSSLLRAEDMMEESARGRELRYVVSGVNVELPVELQTKQGRTQVRFPRFASGDVAEANHRYISRIALSFKVAPVLEARLAPQSEDSRP